MEANKYPSICNGQDLIAERSCIQTNILNGEKMQFLRNAVSSVIENTDKEQEEKVRKMGG